VETFTVNDLAQKTQEAGKALGLEVKVHNIPNPRKEEEEHYYNPSHNGLLSLGLKPHYLTTEALVGMLSVVQKYQDLINVDHILPRVKWQSG
jgi:UDP-sulfoquinovose synthase